MQKQKFQWSSLFVTRKSDGMVIPSVSVPSAMRSFKERGDLSHDGQDYYGPFETRGDASEKDLDDDSGLCSYEVDWTGISPEAPPSEVLHNPYS